MLIWEFIVNGLKFGFTVFKILLIINVLLFSIFGLIRNLYTRNIKGIIISIIGILIAILLILW